MSLKTFHIFFISVSTLLFLAIAVWRATYFAQTGEVAGLLQAVGSLLAAVALVVYGIRILKKLKDFSYL
ncbi:MAG: hypothetical protein ACE5E4_09315 [Candidatus Binatia bacterium]